MQTKAENTQNFSAKIVYILLPLFTYEARKLGLK